MWPNVSIDASATQPRVFEADFFPRTKSRTSPIQRENRGTGNAVCCCWKEVERRPRRRRRRLPFGVEKAMRLRPAVLTAGRSTAVVAVECRRPSSDEPRRARRAELVVSYYFIACRGCLPEVMSCNCRRGAARPARLRRLAAPSGRPLCRSIVTSVSCRYRPTDDRSTGGARRRVDIEVLD